LEEMVLCTSSQVLHQEDSTKSSLSFQEFSSIASLDKKQVEDFADATTRMLKAYKSVGVGSFNMASYSAAVDEKLDSYALCVKFFSRPYPKGVYTNDTGPMERMYDAFVIDSVPEKLAESLRPFFS